MTDQDAPLSQGNEDAVHVSDQADAPDAEGRVTIDDSGTAVDDPAADAGPPPAFPDQPRDQWDPEHAPDEETPRP